jgi:hypothetical protein
MIEQVIEALSHQIVSHSYKRKPDSDSLRKIRISIRKILMDCISPSRKAKRQHWASIHKNSNHYISSQYSNPDITYKIHIERVYESLIQLGYLFEVKSGVFDGNVRYLTRYEATDKLTSLFDENTLLTLPVQEQVSENPELVRVRIEVDGMKQLVGFNDNDDIQEMRRNLEIINAALSTRWIDLELTDDEFEQLETRMHQRSIERNEGEGRLRLHDRQLYRVFNSLDFDRGGRFYGGWWQMVPSEYRRKLLIDGKRTVELDFSTLHPTILYAQAGEILEQDAYQIDLEPITLPAGKASDDFRTVIKRAFNAMLNAEHRLKQPPHELKLSEWGISWKQLVQAIEARHQPVAKHFFTGAGLRLQFEDSQIAEEIMVEFAISMGMVPLLPIHDSFICHHGYVKDVENLMVEKFRNRFGVAIKIKQTHFEVSDNSNSVIEDDFDNILSYMNESHEVRLEQFRNKHIH